MARILAILTYKPRCDDETRPSEQIDSFDHVVTPGEAQSKDGTASKQRLKLRQLVQSAEKSLVNDFRVAPDLEVRQSTGRISPLGDIEIRDNNRFC